MKEVKRKNNMTKYKKSTIRETLALARKQAKQINNGKKADWMFCECIPDLQIQDNLGKAEAKKFWNWMRGQTCPMDGVFESDLIRYLLDLPIVD